LQINVKGLVKRVTNERFVIDQRRKYAIIHVNIVLKEAEAGQILKFHQTLHQVSHLYSHIMYIDASLNENVRSPINILYIG
jgi:hypothetical protein